MIAGCPRCGARYRIAREQIRPEGVRLRCQRCEAAFRVRAPVPPATAAAPAAASAPPADRERLVVLADPDPERSKRIAAALGAAGLEVMLAHDGVEAILTIQRVLPRAVILNASLPKMFGFQICELMKRNESLRPIGVLLVGSVHRAGRYRRPPTDLYGADAYLEEPDVAEAALAELERMGLPLTLPPRSPVPPAPEPVAQSVPAPASREEPTAPRSAPEIREEAAPPPAAKSRQEIAPPPPVPEVREDPSPRPATPEARPLEPAPEPPSPPVSEAVAKAERLARIIVSDIVLYNDEKFTAAAAAGNVLEALEAELEEGRALFRGRVDAEVREARDFLGEELLRVARTRGAK